MQRRVGAVDTDRLAPHKPGLPMATRSHENAMLDGGGVSRAAKGADCKSAGLRLRRFESYLPHQPGIRDQGSVIRRTSGVVPAS